eukprot:TRINITY_DN89367_c0_g1_i1.p1 TRINITY_DN89367_c0_g1~~TRINITY_DN89367_c0_g1_i1.p1  ORF type:complete len:101 (-),score=2.30 TRINITY_DN89367_c0_g1_i1:18-320(-)
MDPSHNDFCNSLFAMLSSNLEDLQGVLANGNGASTVDVSDAAANTGSPVTYGVAALLVLLIAWMAHRDRRRQADVNLVAKHRPNTRDHDRGDGGDHGSIR